MTRRARFALMPLLGVEGGSSGRSLQLHTQDGESKKVVRLRATWRATAQSELDSSVFFCFWFSVFRWRQQLKKHNAHQNMSRIFPSACIRQRTSHFNFPFSHAVTTFLFFFQAITMSKSDDPGGRPFLLLFILCVCVYIYFTINIHLL